MSQPIGKTKADAVPGAVRMYTAGAFGWMIVVEAQNARDALREAKALAPCASLLPSDIQRVRPARQSDIDHYEAMRS